MKSCPQCGRQFPDSESYCGIDGSALTASAAGGGGRPTSVMPPAQGEDDKAIECPVCGGRAQPGETICNFCGTRLAPQGQGPTAPPPTSSAPTGVRQPASAPRVSGNLGPQEFGDESRYDDISESKPERSGVLRFSVAALIALAAGAGLALYLSHRNIEKPIAQASPVSSPSPVSSAPIVQLAKSMPIQVQGDMAGALQRNIDSVQKVFQDNQSGLASAYKEALAADSSMGDGMVVRLHVLPDGSVDNGAVRVSTAPNPSFDAEVIEAMVAWKFPVASGSGVTVDYPVIFATSPGSAAATESDLNTKLASLGPSEPPEYAFAPSGSPSVAAASPSPGPAGSPEVAGVPAAPSSIETPTTTAAAGYVPPPVPVAPPSGMPAPAPPRHHRRPPREMAAVPPPKPPLIERVNDELRASRKLRRVQAYTNGSVVTIYGKVFDDDDRVLAQRTVRHIDGVSAVINNVTTDAQQWAQNEALISQALQNAGLTGVTVKVIGKDAYLSGQVKNQLDKERAVTITQAAAPVKVRMNMITIAVGNMFGF